MSIEGMGSCDDYDAYSMSMRRFEGRSTGGSISGETESNGTSKVSAEAHISHESKDGGRITGSVSGDIERRADGNYSGRAEGRVSWEKEFHPFAIKV